jgi:PiT family inorganic phosphate transporter
MLDAALLVLLTVGLAFANGANDVSKGIATLVGSGVSSDRRALAWGAAWTVVGALGAGFVSRGLVAIFSGSGVLSAPPGSAAFPAAVGMGAVGWLVVATRTALPVSTTHALIGGLVGAGLMAEGPAGVSWASVGHKVALPLAVSPLLSLALVFVIFPTMSLLFRRLNRYCVCLERRELALAPAMPGPAIAAGRALHVIAGADCPPQVLTRVNVLDSVHWLSAGLTSGARALNDAPKILALGLAAAPTFGLGSGSLVAIVALAMGLGSHLAGRRVTHTMADKVTRIAPDDGLAANLVTSALVGIASVVAAPVSTTHVSTGAIVGVGMHRRRVRWKLVGELLLAWVVTVPVAAAIAAASYRLLAP